MSSSGDGEGAATAANNKRKADAIEDKEAQQPNEKEAKTGDPIIDTVLVVNTKVRDTWIRVSKALVEAKVRPCTAHEPGQMRWRYGEYVVILSVESSYKWDAKDAATSYKIARYTPLVKYFNFPEDQRDEMIAFLEATIEQACCYAVRDALLSYVDTEASHWKELMPLIIDNPKIPFAPTWNADANYVSLKWKRGDRCVTLDRSLDDDCDIRFRVDRSRTWDEELVTCKYFQKPEEAVAQVEEWVALL